MSGRSGPARTFWPVSGSRTATVSAFEISMTLDHVSPASVERMTASSIGFGDGCTPDPLNASNTSTSVPSGSTAIWLPIVKRFAPVGLMARGADHVAPPSVVREKNGSPRTAWVRPGNVPWTSLGKVDRSQTAYTYPLRVGSPVIDSLSLKWVAEVSLMRVVGGPQLAPPVVDLDTRTADVSRSADADSEIWYAFPSLSNVTHGSEARSYVPPEH